MLSMNLGYSIISCYYLMIEDFISTTKKSTIFQKILTVFLTGLALLLTCLIITPLYIFKNVINIYLKTKLGKHYGGILPTMDVVYEGCNPKVTINVIYILTHKGNEEQLHENVKKISKKLHNSNYKFSSIVKRFLGYRYYVRDKISIDDVVSTFSFSNEKYITKEKFLNSLDKFYDRTYDKRLWDVNICTQRLLWNEKSRVAPHYAVIIRTNHSVADAYSLCIAHQKYLTEEFVDVTVDADKAIQAMKTGNTKDFLKINVHKMALNIPADFAIGIPHVEADQCYAFMNEDQAKYLPLLKKLKSKHNTTINDILAAGAAQSIFQYFEKLHIDTENITCMMTCRSVRENIKLLLNGNIFGNDVTGILMALPRTLKNTSFTTRLKEIAEICKRSRFSMDRELLYTSFKLGNCLPSTLSEYLFQSISSTLGISNVPLPNINNIGGMGVQDVFGFLNQFANVKFVLCVVSFHNRLHVSLTAKRGMVQSREELQKILKDIFVFIDDLAQEDDILQQTANSPEEKYSQGL